MKKITALFSSKMFTRQLFLVAYDVFAVVASSVLALLFRYNMVLEDIDPKFMDSIKEFMWVAIVLTIAVFYFFRMYHSLWAFAGINEMQNAVTACAVSAALQGVGLYFFKLPVPRSYYFL